MESLGVGVGGSKIYLDLNLRILSDLDLILPVLSTVGVLKRVKPINKRMDQDHRG